jgi:hypothetical protein
MVGSRRARSLDSHQRRGMHALEQALVELCYLCDGRVGDALLSSYDALVIIIIIIILWGGGEWGEGSSHRPSFRGEKDPTTIVG